MNVKNYPYGKVTKTLKSAVSWLNKNKKKIKLEKYWEFDYPDYCGMPPKICSRLSSDEVDWIQEEIDWLEQED